MSCRHYTPALAQGPQSIALPSGSPFAAAWWPSFATLHGAFSALYEGFAAYRDYERLRARGIPHDAAIRQSLGVGTTARAALPDVAGALCFAGKA